jgi:Beta-lactamase class C and other penicillin binding proteins
MMRTILLLCVLLPSIAAWGAGAATATSAPTHAAAATTPVKVSAAAPDFSAVGQRLDAYVPGTVKGYAILILNRNGRLYTHYKGTVWPWTVMPLASASKLAAVATIMRLVDQGKLDLDVPVSRYLAGRIYWPAADTVTLRMLLDHTSGLPGLGPADQPPNPYPYCLGNQSGNLSLQQCAQRIALLPADASPGTTFNYGGADYQMAGYIATLAAGLDWDSLVHDALAVPLQMPSLTFQPDGGNPRIAGGPWPAPEITPTCCACCCRPAPMARRSS